MSRQVPALRYALHVAGCMLPFLALPPLCAPLPAPALQAATFAFVYPLCPALSALVPFRMARRPGRCWAICSCRCTACARSSPSGC